MDRPSIKRGVGVVACRVVGARLARSASRPPHAPRRAFTIIELLFSLAIIFVLMGMLIVGYRHIGLAGRAAADRQMVVSLKLGAEQFRQNFGFIIPLVKDERDGGPLEVVSGRERPVVYSLDSDTDRDYLRGSGLSSDGDLRYSIRSLAYYLVGVLDEPVDGVNGRGLREVRADGSFRGSGGREFEPFYDSGNAGNGGVFIEDAVTGIAEIRDRNGIPIRYYRWLQGDPNNSNKVEKTADMNVPEVLGDPAENQQLRSAEFAIVSAGPNKVFGDLTTETIADLISALSLRSGTPDEEVLRKARADNIVEVGP